MRRRCTPCCGSDGVRAVPCGTGSPWTLPAGERHPLGVSDSETHISWRPICGRSVQGPLTPACRSGDNAHPKPASFTQTQASDSGQPRTLRIQPHAGKVGKRVRGSRKSRHHRNQRRVGNNPHTVLLSHFQWRDDFTQSKNLGAYSTNWNAPELAEYALPRMDNTLLLHGHAHAHDPLEFGRHHNEINVGLDAWHFKPVNEAELADNWLHAALNAD